MSEMERLVLEKHKLIQDRQTLLNMLAVVAVEHGTKAKSGEMKFRVSQAQLNKINGKEIAVVPAGKTGMAVTVKDSA